MTPVEMSGVELADVLRDMADRVQRGDSMEGSVEYHPTYEGGVYEVVGVYRIGNLEGQGGMRMIGDV